MLYDPYEEEFYDYEYDEMIYRIEEHLYENKKLMNYIQELDERRC